jgi:DNA polymerase-1
MSKVLLIDGGSLIYYEAFKDQDLEKAIEGINSRLLHMCEQNDTEKYVGFLTKGSCFRYKVAKSKGYKSTRPAEKPKLLYQLFDYMRDTLKFDIVEQLEADDLVGYWSNQLEGFKTVICSPDKDVLKQIPGKHYNYRWTAKSRGAWVTTSEEDAEKFLWQQVLMGDSTDAIPGLPGIGEKKALKILENSESPLNNCSKTYSALVLSEYVKAFGISEGVSRFAETFRLVYILRTLEDVKRETGLVLEKPQIKVVK